MGSLAVFVKFLFALSVALFIFLALFSVIKQKIGDRTLIQKRMLGIENMNVNLRKPSVVQSMMEQQERERKRARKLEDTPFVERVIVPMRKNIEAFLLRFTSGYIRNSIEHQLMLAGKPARGHSGQFVLKMVVCAAIVGGLLFYALSQKHGMPMPQKMAIFALGTVGGLMFPLLVLRSQIRKRQEAIKKQLPEVLDLLCVSVQAGLSFDAALRKIVVRMGGPFVAECRKMLDDVRMGMTRRDALLGVGYRCDVQEVSLFVTSIIQAERLGSNLSNTLSIQADNVRERHRQWVKAMALKAPVKIVLPLVGFILPAIFIVALGPAVFNIMKNLFK